MRKIVVFLLWTAVLGQEEGTALGTKPPYGYQCNRSIGEGVCVKEKTATRPNLLTLASCKLTCGPFGVMLPRPKEATIGDTVSYFLPTNIKLESTSCTENVCKLVQEAFNVTISVLHKYHPKYSEKYEYFVGPWEDSVASHSVLVNISVAGDEEYLNLNTEESYTLVVNTSSGLTQVMIDAPTFFGARHALESLSQLVDYDEEKDSLQVVSDARIYDAPAFRYRGISLDTSRNFISVEAIKKTIDAMSYNKLNTFHWHITDSNSFPLMLKSLPIMGHFGAITSHQVYHPDDLRDIVHYARIRGVRVLPELDAPAHVGHGWEWGEEFGFGNLLTCFRKQPWKAFCLQAPCGQLNIANERIYDVLETLYRDLVDAFSPINLFHYGGDEVNFKCWNSSTEVKKWMKGKGHKLSEDSYYQEWAAFQERARQLLTKSNNDTEVPGILWTSHLTEGEKLDQFVPKDKYIIEIWSNGTNPVIGNLLKKEYQVIFANSDKFYLDCGFGSWVTKGNNWCSPYKGWDTVFSNDLYAIARNMTGSDHKEQILGGEGALWSEQADDMVLDSRYWPRGSALAERLWSNPIEDYRSVEMRLLYHRQRMVTRGIRADRLQPEYCNQNEGRCPLPPKTVIEEALRAI